MATHPRYSTGVGRGGRREGAGRPLGSRGKRSRKLLAQAKAELLELPVDRLLRRMNDPALAEDYRDHLAAIVAPYTAPRLSAIGRMPRPSEMSDRELDEAIAIAQEDLLRRGVGRNKWPKLVH